MKFITRLVALCFLIAAATAAVWIFLPQLRFAPVCAPAEAWAINQGLIEVEKADWGYLKLRSGVDGQIALRDLERHGATDQIRRTAAAVEMQYMGRGDVIYDVGTLKETASEETRFNELRLPTDGQTLPGAAAVPSTFWPDWRYRAGCVMPPPNSHEQDACRWRVMDLAGSDEPEIVSERQVKGVENLDHRPVVRYVWNIFARKGKRWVERPSLHFCEADIATQGATPPNVAAARLNMVYLGGHAVNFFDETSCLYQANVVMNPFSHFDRLPAMAANHNQIAVLFPKGGKLPNDLITAMEHHSLVSMPIEGSSFYEGLPPCFVSADHRDCSAIVTDIDQDGHDDVIIVNRGILEGGVPYRTATLLMNRNGHWLVAGNRNTCAGDVPDIDKAEVEITAAAWRPVTFAGRLYLPVEPSSSCAAYSIKQ